MVNVEMLDTKYYTSLRKFFQTAKSGDEQQVILSASRGAN